jgi:hypothetical protein
MPRLIPVDHDPFADPTAAGDADDQVGASTVGDLASRYSQWWQAGPLAQGMKPEDVDRLAMGFGTDAGGGGLVGAVKSETPIADTLAQGQLINTLRDQHLARGEAGLPLTGAAGKEPIAPPPHIQTMDDFNGLVDRYSGLVSEGMPYAKDWYPESGAATLFHAGGDPEIAGKLTQAQAGTSQQTPVPVNLRSAVTGHYQAMLGEPIKTGLFPNQMGKALESYYYGNVPISGEKIGPFSTASAEEFLPDLGGHSFVNDIWNMRASEYPGANGGLYTEGVPAGELYDGSPSKGQHNFTRILANAAQDRMAAQGDNLLPKQIQSSSWAAIKSRVEGTPIAAASQNFGDFLRNTYGQLSWESAPGASTDHLPEYFDAPLEQKQEFHNDISSVLNDDQGRFIPALHMGLLSGETLEAPGVWAGQVTPGSQAMVPMGMAPGGIGKTGGMVDSASRTLADATARVTALLLRQDGAAWNRPFYAESMPLRTRNMVQADLGRPPSLGEATAADAAMTDAVKAAGGNPGAFSPISTPTGFRFINDPAESGLSHPAFQKLAGTLFGSENPALPDYDWWSGHADGFLEKNNWKEDPNGERYLQGLSAAGSPGLQGRAADLLAVLGPRIADVEEKFARNYGWTPNRDTRVWENPVIQQHAGTLIPNPPRPWRTPTSGPPGPGPAPPGGPLFLGDPGLEALRRVGS